MFKGGIFIVLEFPCTLGLVYDLAKHINTLEMTNQKQLCIVEYNSSDINNSTQELLAQTHSLSVH